MQELERLELIRDAAMAGLVHALVTPDQLVLLCEYRIIELRSRQAHRERMAELEAKRNEPNPCEVCGKNIEPGSPTYAGIAHWECRK